MIDMEMWRQQVIDSLDRLFSNQDSALYGIKHALAVEQQVLDIIRLYQHSSKSDCMKHDLKVLQTAALLHDVGFAERNNWWSMDGYEHIDCGIDISLEILKQNPLFKDRHDDINQVLLLVEHHDDTTYSFSTKSNMGQPFVTAKTRFQEFQPSNIQSMLDILKEADAHIHTSDQCIHEAYDEWLENKIPIFLNHERLLTTWRWNDSAVGNIRLLGKRILIDNNTPEKMSDAISSYERLEKFVKNQCHLSRVKYEPEICLPKESGYPINDKSSAFEIVAFNVMDEFKEKLHSVPLVGNRAIKPYENANICVDSYRLSHINPMSLYVLSGNLQFQRQLFNALMANYALGLWDLTGLLKFKLDSQAIYQIAPPVIEIYCEKDDGQGERQVMALVDGLHRCLVARENNYDRIFTIAISDVPYPLVPLPTDWDSIIIYDKPPRSDFSKRKYRFKSLAEFPNTFRIKNTPKDNKEVRYFFFRKLDVLGSKGIRNLYDKK